AALERVDEALDRRRFMARAGKRHVIGISRGLKGSARPLERAVHRRWRRAEHPGHLGRRESQDVAQDKSSALLVRKTLEPGHERKCDRLSDLEPSLGTPLDISDESVGVGLEPPWLIRVHQTGRQRAWIDHVGVPWPARRVTEVVETTVGSD